MSREWEGCVVKWLCILFVLNDVNLHRFDHSGPRIPCAPRGCDLLAWGHGDIAVQSLRAAEAHHHLEGSRPEHPWHRQQLGHIHHLLLVSRSPRINTPRTWVQLLFWLPGLIEQLPWVLFQHKSLASVRREIEPKTTGGSRKWALVIMLPRGSVPREV